MFSTTIANFRYRSLGLRLVDKGGLLVGLGGHEMAFGSTEDGMLRMNKLDAKPGRMIQIEPCLFRSIDDRYLCAFRLDASAKVTHLFTNGVASFERVSRGERYSQQQSPTAIARCLLSRWQYR